jgi:glyoxylase-like metal-dependent hydrolase (beta-lactamase superfamily II)
MLGNPSVRIRSAVARARVRRPAALAGCAALLFVAAGATARADTMIQHKIADNVYMMQNDRGSSNSTFFITPDGVLVFDADLKTADQVLAAIRKLTDKKVKYLITSHSAGDHATGAWHYREDHPIYISSRRQMHDFFMQEGAEFAERKASNAPQNAHYHNAELVRADIGFDGALTLKFGGLTFQLTEEGRGHSTSDVTAYVPEKRVMLMGDLLDTEIHPGQSESGEVFYANVADWVAHLDNVMSRHLPADTYVPGHGPVHIGRGVADLEEQKHYFLVMRDEVSKMIAQGKTADEIKKEFVVPKEFAHYTRKPRLDTFIKLYYGQLTETGY